MGPFLPCACFYCSNFWREGNILHYLQTDPLNAWEYLQLEKKRLELAYLGGVSMVSGNYLKFFYLF